MQNRPLFGVQEMNKAWRVGLAWNVMAYGDDAISGIAEYSRRFGPFQFVGSRVSGLSDINLKNIHRRTDIHGLLTFDWVEWQDLEDVVWPKGVPIVSAEPNPSKFTRYQVLPDNRGVGRIAADELLDRGVKRFGYCPFWSPRPRIEMGSQQWDAERMEGFCSTVQAASGTMEIYSNPRGSRMSYETEWNGPLATWIKSLPKPVGILAASDLRARHLLLAADASGVRVPEEAAVIGVDNMTWTKLTLPAISSIELDGFGAGYAAMEMLHRLMEAKPVERELVRIPPRRLIRRRSSDMLAIEDADVVAAMRFIAERATEGIKVEQVVEAVAVSRRALERRFRSWLRRSILDEIHAVRMARAKVLLADPSIPMRRVADVSGFKSAKALSTIFRRITGVTPSAYRDSAKSANGEQTIQPWQNTDRE